MPQNTVFLFKNAEFIFMPRTLAVIITIIVISSLIASCSDGQKLTKKLPTKSLTNFFS